MGQIQLPVFHHFLEDFHSSFQVVFQGTGHGFIERNGTRHWFLQLRQMRQIACHPLLDFRFRQWDRHDRTPRHQQKEPHATPDHPPRRNAHGLSDSHINMISTDCPIPFRTPNLLHCAFLASCTLPTSASKRRTFLLAGFRFYLSVFLYFMLNIRGFFVLLPLRHKSNLQQPALNAPNTHGTRNLFVRISRLGFRYPKRNVENSLF